MAQVNTEITVIKIELSKREYFAAMAMQGIVGSIDSEENYQRLKTLANAQNMKVSYWIARDAVKQADALINALNKDYPFGNPMEGDI